MLLNCINDAEQQPFNLTSNINLQRRERKKKGEKKLRAHFNNSFFCVVTSTIQRSSALHFPQKTTDRGRSAVSSCLACMHKTLPNTALLQ